MIFKRKKIIALEKHLQNIHSPGGCVSRLRNKYKCTSIFIEKRGKEQGAQGNALKNSKCIIKTQSEGTLKPQ